jgi:hypothetical protein
VWTGVARAWPWREEADSLPSAAVRGRRLECKQVQRGVLQPAGGHAGPRHADGGDARGHEGVQVCLRTPSTRWGGRETTSLPETSVPTRLLAPNACGMLAADPASRWRWHPLPTAPVVRNRNEFRSEGLFCNVQGPF